MQKKWIIGIGVGVILLMLASTKKAFAAVVPSQRIRGCDADSLGCGAFGSSRTGHTHQGIDIVASKGQRISSPISGRITRFPFPYGDDLRYTGIEIKNSQYAVKIFYVTAIAEIGDSVSQGEEIAIAQDIAAKYSSKMTNHVHLEVRDLKGNILDPTKLF